MNSIHWLSWNTETFVKAQQEKKPLLLDLSAVWCHWCHRQDEDTYSRLDIIDFINEHFIPVKVDIDQRPDIAERYNLGGFPTTAFLDDQGFFLVGGTYIPPDHFRHLMTQVVQGYKDKKLGKQVTFFEQRVQALQEAGNMCTPFFDVNIIDTVFHFILQEFDEAYGGFGMEQKFPMPEVLDFLLFYYQRTGEQRVLGLLKKTLDSMVGIFDHEEGGFFRYSVTRDWSEPHYEKMLEGNAQLLRIYLEVFTLTHQEKYKEIAIKTLHYVQKNLQHAAGGFYANQDADEAYYKASLEERKNKKKPFISPMIYTDWSSMMISSFIRAATILDQQDLLAFTKKSLDYLLSNNKNKRLMHSSQGQEVFLSDYAFLIKALLDYYDATHEQHSFTEALHLMQEAQVRLYDTDRVVFFDRSIEHDALGLLSKPNIPFTENMMMVMNLLRLSTFTEDKKLREQAKNILLHFSCTYKAHGLFAASFAIAVGFYLTVSS